MVTVDIPSVVSTTLIKFVEALRTLLPIENQVPISGKDEIYLGFSLEYSSCNVKLCSQEN